MAIIYHIYSGILSQLPEIKKLRESGLSILEIENMVSKGSKSGASTTTLLTDSDTSFKRYIRSVFLNLWAISYGAIDSIEPVLGVKMSLSGRLFSENAHSEHPQSESELNNISTLYICIGILCKCLIKKY